MAAAVVPTPRVEDEPIATMVNGLPAAIRDAARSRGAMIADNPVGVAQLGEPTSVGGSACARLPPTRTSISAAARCLIPTRTLTGGRSESLLRAFWRYSHKLWLPARPARLWRRHRN